MPAISGTELQQIIKDEAAHESVYSFTNEKIAVAYQILKDKINKNGIWNTEVFAVTTLESTIHQIIEVLRNTDIILESITPALWGLSQYLTQYHVDLYKSSILILVSGDEAEFYLWKGKLPYACHYIKAGSSMPETLQNEVTSSLEHFNKQIVDESLISRVVVVGEKCELKLSAEYKVDYPVADQWPDLLGLALVTKDLHVLNYITKSPKSNWPVSVSMNKLGPVIIGGLVCFNVLIGWNLWSDGQRLAPVKSEYQHLQNLLSTKAQKRSNMNSLPKDVRFNIAGLLEKIRGIVTEDMMFDKLGFDIEHKNLQVEGFCIKQKNLNLFLTALSQIKGVQSVDEIASSQQTRVNLIGYAFRCHVTLVGDFSNDQ